MVAVRSLHTGEATLIKEEWDISMNSRADMLTQHGDKRN